MGEEGLSQKNFMRLLTNRAEVETMAIEQFLSMSCNGETVTLEQCRNGLLQFGKQQCEFRASQPPQLSEDQWNRILESVLGESKIKTVTLEIWISFCRRASRMARLAYYVIS